MKARLPQGYGKQSQQQLMQQVQQMQENMRLKQEELENTEYSVTSPSCRASAGKAPRAWRIRC